MKILCLYSKEFTLELFEWIKNQGNEIVLKTERLDPKWCEAECFDLAISYTYTFIIKTDIIDIFKGNMVNIHIAYLPFDKGSYPNLWNILQRTPRGVSIHYIDQGIDTGDIIAQQIVELEEPATLQTSYEQLDRAAKKLFKQIFGYYPYWNSMRKKCLGKGTHHTDKDLEEIKKHFDSWDWSMSVEEYIKKWTQV